MFDDARWNDSRERNDDSRDLSRGGRGPSDPRSRAAEDPRDVFMRELAPPRSREREPVHDRDREYSLRESETRTLETVGAFRIVSSRDLGDRQALHARFQRFVLVAYLPDVNGVAWRALGGARTLPKPKLKTLVPSSISSPVIHCVGC